jgi:hypothetical protein
MATRIQVRRGTTSDWNTSNPILTEGEFGYNTTLDKFKIGDGTSTWSVLEYVPTSADLSSSLGDYIALTEKGGADGVAELDATYNVLTKTAVVFEGATADAYETTLLVTDPTADRTLTLPNATGTVALTSDLSSYAPLANPTFTGTVNAAALTLSGDLTVNGTTTTVNSTTINVTNAFVFEGTTADAFETTLTVTDPTADRTITLPDSTGTVALTTDLSSYIPLSTFDTKGDLLVASADNTVAKLAVGTNGYILTANSSATNGVEWAAAPISLPSQTGNTGKYLTTDGTTASWATISADIESVTAGTGLTGGGSSGAVTVSLDTTSVYVVPSQTGHNGKYLTTDGSTSSWATVSSYSAPTLGSTSIASGATVTTIAGLTLSNATLSGSLTAGGGTGTSGQVLASTGSGVQWTTPAGGAAFSEFMLIGA